jgi:hypothetical protein
VFAFRRSRSFERAFHGESMVRGAAKPPEGELEAIARSALLQRPRDMKFNGSLPDSEKFRDLAVS